MFTFCQTNTLWTTAPPQKRMPSPMSTADTMAGVESKWRNVQRTTPENAMEQICSQFTVCTQCHIQRVLLSLMLKYFLILDHCTDHHILQRISNSQKIRMSSEQRVSHNYFDQAKYQNRHSSKSVCVIKLSFCQNDAPIGESFWQNTSLVT